jgi:hypothetical protein
MLFPMVHKEETLFSMDNTDGSMYIAQSVMFTTECRIHGDAKEPK